MVIGESVDVGDLDARVGDGIHGGLAHHGQMRRVSRAPSPEKFGRPDADDAGRIAGTNANVAGRTLGGGMGFGLLGAAASQSSKYVGLAFGYYGLAWSVYANVIARGGEVQFSKNAMMDIKFGARTPPPGSKFRSEGAATGQ